MVVTVDGSAAVAAAGLGVVTGDTRVLSVAEGIVGLGVVVEVLGCVGTGVVAGSTLASGLDSGFTVGVMVRTVGGVEGNTTMMLGRGAAVGRAVATGTVATGSVDDCGAASVDCASASTAFEVSLSLVCKAAS